MYLKEESLQHVFILKKSLGISIVIDVNPTLKREGVEGTNHLKKVEMFNFFQ